jgi:16S rRNA (guanine527-N7)-methyltransferase
MGPDRQMFHVKHLADEVRCSPRRFHVKHLDSTHRKYLQRLLCGLELGVEVGEDSQQLMLEHLDFVLEWNGRINLTTITDPMEAIRLHIVDSLIALPEVMSLREGLMCDLGSGGGFPGIPLAIASGRDTVLVESVQKKARLLAQFIQQSTSAWSERVTVEPVRAEEYALRFGGQASLVTARALSQLGSLVELASPLLRPEGALVALKGPITEAELEVARDTARMTGMEVVSTRREVLPQDGEARTIVTVVRTGKSIVKLPRRTGMAQREPLFKAGSRQAGSEL